jgi:site-specific recombinase XerD
LKELASVCGIEKEITFHTARHTFATMMLNNGVSIVNLQAMLGHKNLKDTQHYAKTLDETIVNDMKSLKNKFKASTLLQEKTGS